MEGETVHWLRLQLHFFSIETETDPAPRAFIMTFYFYFYISLEGAKEEHVFIYSTFHFTFTLMCKLFNF